MEIKQHILAGQARVPNPQPKTMYADEKLESETLGNQGIFTNVILKKYYARSNDEIARIEGLPLEISANTSGDIEITSWLDIFPNDYYEVQDVSKEGDDILSFVNNPMAKTSPAQSAVPEVATGLKFIYKEFISNLVSEEGENPDLAKPTLNQVDDLYKHVLIGALTELYNRRLDRRLKRFEENLHGINLDSEDAIPGYRWGLAHYGFQPLFQKLKHADNSYLEFKMNSEAMFDVAEWGKTATRVNWIFWLEVTRALGLWEIQYPLFRLMMNLMNQKLEFVDILDNVLNDINKEGFYIHYYARNHEHEEGHGIWEAIFTLAVLFAAAGLVYRQSPNLINSVTKHIVMKATPLLTTVDVDAAILQDISKFKELTVRYEEGQDRIFCNPFLDIYSSTAPFMSVYPVFTHTNVINLKRDANILKIKGDACQLVAIRAFTGLARGMFSKTELWETKAGSFHQNRGWLYDRHNTPFWLSVEFDTPSILAWSHDKEEETRWSYKMTLLPYKGRKSGLEPLTPIRLFESIDKSFFSGSMMPLSLHPKHDRKLMDVGGNEDVRSKGWY